MGSPAYRQVLRPERVQLYMANRQVAGFACTHVQGFVSLLADTAEVTDPSLLWGMLRPDHPGIDLRPVPFPTGGVDVLDFTLDDDFPQSVHPSTGGGAGQSASFDFSRFLDPWTGTGVSASELAMVRESVIDLPALVMPGARITHVHPDGTTELLAVLDVDVLGRPRWSTPEGDSVAPADGVEPVPRLYVDAQGRVPAHTVGEGLVSVPGADERAVRLRLQPDAVEACGATSGRGWALVASTALPRTWVVTSATSMGLPVGVQYTRISEEGLMAGVCYVGRPFEGMGQAGWWGDQYCGFHTEVPWSSLQDVSANGSGIDPSPRPEGLTVPDIPSDPVLFAWGEDYIAPGGTSPTPVDHEGGRVWVNLPHFQAADVMFPGHGEVVPAPGGGVRVDLAPLGAPRADVLTQGLLDGAPVLVLGTFGEDYVIIHPDDATTVTPDSPTRRVPRASVEDLHDEVTLLGPRP